MKTKFTKLALLRLVIGGAILGSAVVSLLAPSFPEVGGAMVGGAVSVALIKFAHIPLV